VNQQDDASQENVPIAPAQFILGEATDAAARLYVRLSSAQLGEPWTDVRLRGVVRGPRCRYARTLPASVALAPRDHSGRDIAAQAYLPEPCYWTPKLPFVYDVSFELAREGQVLWEGEATVGLRRLGARGGHLWMEGRRYVVRGGRCEPQCELPCDAWHEEAAAMLMCQPPEAVCRAATDGGVLIVARVGGDRAAIEVELRRLAQWASAGIAIVEPVEQLPAEIRSVAPNLLLAESRDEFPREPLAAWAHLALWRTCDLHSSMADPITTRQPAYPIIALAPEPESIVRIDTVRSACDTLQRRLTPWGDFAGYLV